VQNGGGSHVVDVRERDKPKWTDLFVRHHLFQRPKESMTQSGLVRFALVLFVAGTNLKPLFSQLHSEIISFDFAERPISLTENFKPGIFG